MYVRRNLLRAYGPKRTAMDELIRRAIDANIAAGYMKAVDFDDDGDPIVQLTELGQKKLNESLN